ncbi:hypothetical protein BDZ89DRAFT_1164941 [Hymenopellis radicata]|nr:hypothetical protein BDZ89DRAFT_1164941 [Hymenopellis radicata]
MTTNLDKLLTKYDIHKFSWTTLASNDPAFPARTRLLFGGENIHDVMNRYMKGDQTLFFALSIQLIANVPRNKLIVACRESWLWLRYHIPTVACTIHVDGDDQGHLQYHSPTPSSASAWADRTFCVHSGLDLDTLRREVGPWPVPSSAGDQTWLHFSCTDSDSAHVSEFGLLFHSHHTPFDGTGVKLIMIRYLEHLSRFLSSSREEVVTALQWGTEVENLTPCVSDVLSDDEPLPIPLLSDDLPTFLHPYYGSLKQVNDTMNDKHGFRARQAATGSLPSCHRAALLLSQEDTSFLLTALKSIPSSHAYTVTHLAHAALSMVTVNDNPPSKGSQSFLNNFSITNYRHRLQPEYTRSYTGYSVGTSIFRIPVSLFSAGTANSTPSQALNARTLAKAMSFVRATYEVQAAIPAPLSTMGQLAELQAVSMKKAATKSLITPNHCYMFSSDGIGERYLPPEYADENGAPVLCIKSFFTSLNRVDPGPFFRISTWKGQMELSADYNSKAVDGATVKRHLEKWKEFMFLVSSNAICATAR